jgi:HEAT repeat protein
MGDSSAEPALIDALRHENPYVRYASIQALREIGTRESLPALTAIQIHDESMVHLNHGFDFVSLKMAAATATHAIRARHQLKT